MTRFRPPLLPILFTLAAVFVTPSWGGELTLSPAGGNIFQIVASGLQQVGGVDVTITYDPNAYGSPQVTQAPLASGSFFAANTNIPGQIRIALVHASGINGSGPLVSIAFGTVRSSSTPPVLRVNSMIDTRAQTLIAGGAPPSTPPTEGGGGTFTSLPGKPFSVSPEPTESLPSGGGAVTPPRQSPIATFPGTITLPGSGSTEPPRNDTPPSPPPVMEPPEPPTAPSSPSRPETQAPPAERRPLPSPPESVLERMAAWKGERSVATLAPLFDRSGGSWVTQTPPIALADGKTPFRVFIDPGWKTENPPSFALKGVTMKSLGTRGHSGWELELVPAAGVTVATLTLDLDDQSAAIPLVVVPPLPREWGEKPLTDEVVNRFLTNRDGKGGTGDLNGDGKRDYLDDYIMVGHLLRSRPAPETDGRPGKTKRPEKGDETPPLPGKKGE